MIQNYSLKLLVEGREPFCPANYLKKLEELEILGTEEDRNAALFQTWDCWKPVCNIPQCYLAGSHNSKKRPKFILGVERQKRNKRKQISIYYPPKDLKLSPGQNLCHWLWVWPPATTNANKRAFGEAKEKSSSEWEGECSVISWWSCSYRSQQGAIKVLLVMSTPPPYLEGKDSQATW